MTVISVTPDSEALSLTIVAEFAAPPARVWQVWADARVLEQWWGPPTWPATFTEHALAPGGASEYYMTGPQGEKAGGWWDVLEVHEPEWFTFEDGFSTPDGQRDLTMPVTRTQVTLDPVGAGSRMTLVSSFFTAQQMDQLLHMGMDEGMREAMGQIDALLEP